MRRIRHAIFILCKPVNLERLEYFMALEKTVAALAELQNAVNNLIAKCSDHSAEIASLKQQIADDAAADDAAAASVQAMTAAVNGAAPQ